MYTFEETLMKDIWERGDMYVDDSMDFFKEVIREEGNNPKSKVLGIYGKNDVLVGWTDWREWMAGNLDLISWIVIHPRFRRQGAATAVLEYVLEMTLAANGESLSICCPNDYIVKVMNRLNERIGREFIISDCY